MHQMGYDQAFQMAAQTQIVRQQGLVVDNESSSDDEDDEQKRTLFCAGLDDRITEELLYEAFLQAGPIESVRIPKDNVGRQRGFGFVTYVHACSAPYAMELMEGLSLFGRHLIIKYQGQTQIPRRAPQPSVCEKFEQRRSNDNSSLHADNFAAYDPTRNPFKGNDDALSSSVAVVNRTRKVRPHHLNAYMPYPRTGRDSHERRQHHNDNNRRSDRDRKRHR